MIESTTRDNPSMPEICNTFMINNQQKKTSRHVSNSKAHTPKRLQLTSYYGHMVNTYPWLGTKLRTLTDSSYYKVTSCMSQCNKVSKRKKVLKKRKKTAPQKEI